MTDKQRLMDVDTIFSTVQNIKPYVNQIAKRLGLIEQAVLDKLEIEKNYRKMLEHFRFDYLAPCDITSPQLIHEGFDVITSRAVLEHVPQKTLRVLLDRVFQLLKPGGWTCHAVDNSDHWSHSDTRLSRVNFLRYSEGFFTCLNCFNALDYQNRLRHPEYTDLLRELGFNVLIAKSEVESQALTDLNTLPIAVRFQKFTVEDLARLDSYFVARRCAPSFD